MKGKGIKTLSRDDIKQALLKRAIGFDAKEVIEEYVGGDDGVKLTKKKVTYKFVPPDVTALKILIDDSEQDLGQLTEEQLQKEKERLLELLSASEQLNKEKESAKNKRSKSVKKTKKG